MVPNARRLLTLPALLALSALQGLSGLGCSAEPSDDEDISSLQSDAITGAQGEKCDRSPYNCKVPNFESIPDGIKRDTNRAFNHFDNTYHWPFEGEPALRDGANNIRGYLAGDEGNPHHVKLNFGARKTLGGVAHVYAFSALLTDGHGVSGWIPASAIQRPKTLAKMPSATPGNPGTEYYETDWVVTGGDLLADQQTLELNDRYGDLRVNPNVTDAERASDYLVRQWDPSARRGYVNFLYNLPHSGGVSRDTLPMCTHFKRFKGVDQLESQLWFTNSTSLSKLSLHFVFGTIDGRRGWMTKEMLTPASELGKLDPSHPCAPGQPGAPADPPAEPPPPPPEDSAPPAEPPKLACHVLCCLSGPGVGDFSVADGGACIDQAQSFCADHGHVQSALADGATLFSREGSTKDLRCWAKCKARKDYHEVVGVSEDCAGKAKNYCDVGDRGGLGDAMWNRCNPN